MTEDTRVDWTRQSEANESAEVRPAGQEGASEKHPCAPPKGGGSGFGEGPEMGCGASAQSPPVGVPSPITTSGPRKGAEMGRVASAQTQLGEQTGRGREGEGGATGGREREGGREAGEAGSEGMQGGREPGGARPAPHSPAPKSGQGQMDSKAAGVHSIAEQMQCDKHTEEEILEEKLEKLFEALRKPDDPKLRKSIIKEERKNVLADGLVALGISRRADAFINDLFDGVTDGNTEELAKSEFKDKVKEERQISLRFLFLHNLNLNPKLSVFYFFTCLQP